VTLFRILNLRRFAEHRTRTALSVSGIAIGSALLVAVLGLLGSLTGSVKGFVDDLSGPADLEVSAVSNSGFDEVKFFDIEGAKGVAAAVPVVRSRVVADGTPVLFLGIDQRAEKLRTNLMDQPRSTTMKLATRPGVLVGEGLAKKLRVRSGGIVSIFSSGGKRDVPVLGVVTGKAAQFSQGMFAVTSIPYAQQVLGKGPRIDSVYVIAKPGVDKAVLEKQLAQKLGTAAFVDSPTGRVREAQTTTASLRFGMLMGVSIAMTVGAFLVFNTMSMAALERRRELATLRALGGPRRKLLVMFLAEAALVGLAGSVIGAGAGVLIARALVGAVPDFYTSQLNTAIKLQMPAYAIPLAIAVSVVSAVAAAFMPGRKAVGVLPADSMRPEGVLETYDQVDRIAPGPTLFGFALITVSFVTAVKGPGDLAFIAMAGLMTGAIIATYGLNHPLTVATARLASRFGISGRLAASAVRRAPRRAWATSIAVVAGVGMIVTQASSTMNISASVNRSVASLGAIDLYVNAASGTSLAADILLPREWEGGLAKIPGVENVGVNTFQFVRYAGDKVLVQGTSNSLGAEPAMAGVSAADRGLVEAGKAAIVSTRFTELFGVGTGGTVRLPTPTGVHPVKVIGSVPSFTWDRGLVTIGGGLITRWFGPLGASDYLLSFSRGADPEAVRASVEKFVAGSPVPVYVSSGSQYLAAISATVKQIQSLFDSLVAVVVGAAILAIINALIISVIERRAELGIMRALGTSRRQLREMVALEAGALGVVGGLAGVALGFLAHRAAIVAVGHQGGMPVTYAFQFLPALIAFPAGILMAIAGSLEPARRAGAIEVVEAIGYE
jgi:putative ABC transport system permease protein